MEPAVSSSPARFYEAHGRLEQGRSDGPPIVHDTVMLTNIEKGCTLSRPADGLTLRYVGRGEERYRIGGRSFRLSEGQLMIARQREGAEIDIPLSGTAGTLGLCAFLAKGDLGELDLPVVIGAGCSSVGRLMEHQLKALVRSTDRARDAIFLVDSLRFETPPLITELAAQSDRLSAVRSRTRLDAIRKISMARTYLHSITDRAVGLDELAVATGMSRFHLQRSFQQAIGQSPAAYHRRLRLDLALGEAKRRRLSLDTISTDFGFAGASSLSHAYKRSYGRSPIWSKETHN